MGICGSVEVRVHPWSAQFVFELHERFCLFATMRTHWVGGAGTEVQMTTRMQANDMSTRHADNWLFYAQPAK